MDTDKTLPILKSKSGIGIGEVICLSLSEKDYSQIDYMVRRDVCDAFLKWAEKHDEELEARKKLLALLN